MNHDLQRFFNDYATASTSGHPQEIAAFYSDSFLVAGPTGSATFQNDDRFLEWLKQLDAFNRQTGLRSMQVTSVEVSPISPDYSLALVGWAAKFEKIGGQPIEFQITYIVQVSGEKPRIIGYVSHQDQETMMRELGLL